MLLKRTVTTLLIVLLVNLGTFAFSAGGDDAKTIEQLKAEIAKLGTGTDAKVQVTLSDGTKVKGYVSKVDNDQFVVTDPKSGTTTPIPYPAVKKAKISRKTIGYLIGIGAIASIFIVLAIVAHDRDF